MQTREKPPITVHPDVEHLMKGDMLQVRDFMLDRITALAEIHNVAIVRIMIQCRVWTEDDFDDEDVVFTIDVDTDDDARAFRYWEAVSDAMSPETAPESARGLWRDFTEKHVHLMNNTWVQVYW